MPSFRPFRGVPCASRAVLFLVLLGLLGLSSGAQGPGNSPAVIGEVFSSDAAVQGSVMLAGGGIQVLSGSSVSAGHGTATLKLKRGGELRVCSGTTVSLSASASGRELLLGFSGGVIETRYSLPLVSDTVLTPDFRLLLAGPGAFHFAIGSDKDGGTCVRALEASSASIIVYELMGSGAYQVKPGDNVYFPRGEVASVQSPAPASCGCPPPQRVLQRAEAAPVGPLAAPTSETAPSTPMVTFVEPARLPALPEAGPPPALASNPQALPSAVVLPARRPALEPVTDLAPSRALNRPEAIVPPTMALSQQSPPRLVSPPRAVILEPVVELSAVRPAQETEAVLPPNIPSGSPAPAPLPPAPVAAEPVTVLSAARPPQSEDVAPPALPSSTAPPVGLSHPATPALETVTELPPARPLPGSEAAPPPRVAQAETLPEVALPPRPVRTEPVTVLAASRPLEMPGSDPPPPVSSDGGIPLPAPPRDLTLPPPPVSAEEVRFQVDAPMVFRAEDLPEPSPQVTRADLRTPLPFLPPAVAPPPAVTTPREPVAEPAPAPKPRKKGFFSRIGGFFARLFGRGGS